MRTFLALVIVGVFAGAIGAAENLPAFKAERWVNSAPLTAAGLRGKVVLVDFWEYTCINWIRTLRLVARGARQRHVLTLVTSDPGVRAFAFTFGP